MNYNNKIAYVIDAQGFYVTNVLVLEKPVYAMPPTQEEEREAAEATAPRLEWEVQHYTLKDGESLIDAEPPAFRVHMGTLGLVSPRWDGATWTEGATAEEIAAWEQAHPAPEPPAPRLEERNRADIDFLAIMQGVQL